MRADVVAQQFGTSQHFTVNRIATFGGMGACQVQQGVGARIQIQPKTAPFIRVGWMACQQFPDEGDFLPQFLQGDSQCAPVIGDVGDCVHEQLMNIRQTRQRNGEGERALQHFPAGLTQCQQMPSQIAAIHRGHIARFQDM